MKVGNVTMMSKIYQRISLTIVHFCILIPVYSSNCAGVTTSFVPLTDLGIGTYQGYTGGLYLNGSNNRPFAHNSAGVVIATTQIKPLNTLGNPDSTTGKIALISI